MLFATVGQWKVFLAMMVAGLLAGGVYDLLAALRHLLRAGPLISLAADLAFGLLSALLLGGMLTFACYGSFARFAVKLCAKFDRRCAVSPNFVLLKSFFVKGKRSPPSNH